jgi:flagellar biosynthetic protein FlhB
VLAQKEDMAEERFESRSEPASSKRLAEARARGEVPRSADLGALAVLLAAAGMLSFGGGKLFQSLASMLVHGLQGAARFSVDQAFELARGAGFQLLELLAALFVAAMLAPLFLSGWVFAPRVMTLEAGRLNPFMPLGRLFSLKGFYGALKGLLALALMASLAWHYLHSHLTELFSIWKSSVPESLPLLAAWLGRGLMMLAGGVAVVALMDSLWQWWRHLSSLAMTRSEVLAEAQEEEMSAAVRARMARARETAARASE